MAAAVFPDGTVGARCRRVFPTSVARCPEKCRNVPLGDAGGSSNGATSAVGGGLEPLLLLVDRAQLVSALERPVIRVRGTRPGNAPCPGDVPTAEHSLLRILGHVGALPGVLLRAADIDERLLRVRVREDLV